MINLFRKKSTPENGQDISSIPAEHKGGKRGYSYLLEFRCRGQLFADLETNNIKQEVFKIGKSANSDLLIPEADRLAQEHHLELQFTPHSIKVQAVPGSFFYFNSRKNTVAALKLHDRIAFGDCELTVKESLNDEDSFSKVHRLEFTNGEKKGEMILLEKDLIKIGSAPENDIVLKDEVVSRFHARIRITENGECWLKDLQSINGTSVNEVKLDTQERMLMDSDEISFASVTMLFLDRKVDHTRSQIGRKIFIMGITIAVIALIFALFYAVTPHASQLLLAAEYYTARGDFFTAQKMLDRMSHAKEYNTFKEQHRLFNEKLDRYRNTMDIWEEFKKNLKNSQWRLAVGNCGMLDENNRAVWNWNEETADQQMNELKYAKMLLNLHSDIQSLLYSSVLTLEQKKEKNAELQKKVLPPLKDEISWCVPLRKEIAENSRKLKESVAVWTKAEQLLGALADENCDMMRLLEEMEKLHSSAVGVVRTRLFGINDILKQLQENDATIRKNRRALCEMQLNSLEKSISFVSQDACLINPHLVSKREQLIANHRKLLEIANNITIQYQKLCVLGANGGKLPAKIAKMLDEKRLLAMLKAPFAAVDGVDLYEQFFGSRYFYLVMKESAVHKENLYSEELLSGLTQAPLCVQLKNIFEAAENAHLYMQTLKKTQLLKDNIGIFDNACLALLAQRKRVVDFFRAAAVKNKDSRNYFIAQTAVFYFSTPGSADALEMKNFAEKWKKHQAEMQNHITGYNPLDRKKVQQLREKIQTHGVPGDPAAMMLRWMK